MLVLSRFVGQRVMIGNDVVVMIVGYRHGKVRLGFEAPKGIPIYREELLRKINAELSEAAQEDAEL